DTDLPAATQTLSRLGGRPVLSLTPTTGVLTWTPTEAQGPSTNTITVKVTDDGTPALSATNSFTVVVNEVNSAPTLTVPSDQTIKIGRASGRENAGSEGELAAYKRT